MLYLSVQCLAAECSPLHALVKLRFQLPSGSELVHSYICNHCLAVTKFVAQPVIDGSVIWVSKGAESLKVSASDENQVEI